MNKMAIIGKAVYEDEVASGKLKATGTMRWKEIACADGETNVPSGKIGCSNTKDKKQRILYGVSSN